MLPEELPQATEAYSYPLLIKQLWHSVLVRFPDQEIVYRDQRRLTYTQLRERVGRLASALSKLGVSYGETVAVMDWDSHRYLEAYFAIPMMGAALMTVNVRLSLRELSYTINESAATVLLVHEDFKPVINALRSELHSVISFIWITDTGNPYDHNYAGEYEDLLSKADPSYKFDDFNENTTATMFFTTGTTGLPKGVYFSHRQIVLHSLAVLGLSALSDSPHGFNANAVYMPLTPMFHVHAWGCPYTALMLGIKQIYPGRYNTELLLTLIDREHVTYSHCVPSVLHMLLAHPKSHEVDFTKCTVNIGGSALSTGLAELACSRGINIFGGYGMSETCPLLTVATPHPILGELDPSTNLRFRCKAGAPAPLVEIRIVDSCMKDVANGESGEVVVRAPWLTQGYINSASSAEELWAGGYLHTQDIGYFERGYLKITDRIKDVIKTGGEWVSSIQIEDIISSHPAVAECAVIGVPDDKWGERPLGIVTLRPGMSGIESETIRQHVRFYAEQGEIPSYAVPDNLMIVGAIERTSVGKIDKKMLRDKYASGYPKNVR